MASMLTKRTAITASTKPVQGMLWLLLPPLPLPLPPLLLLPPPPLLLPLPPPLPPFGSATRFRQLGSATRFCHLFVTLCST